MADAKPAACRRDVASWPQSAPTARNMIAPLTTAKAKYNAAPVPMLTFEDRPTAAVMSAEETKSARAPAPRPSSACWAALRRVTGPTRRSSQRPASSSPRVSLVLVRMPHTAPMIASTVRHFHAVKPGTVPMLFAGPTRALIPVYVFLMLPALAVVSSDTKNFLSRTAEAQWGVMVCVYCISHVPALLMLQIAHCDLTLLLVFLVLVVQASDVLQYIWGKLFGRHKIAPVVSRSEEHTSELQS